MAQFLNTPWISTPVPGAYVNTTVISSSSGLATSGVILIMGESTAGPSYKEVALKNNFFGPTALNTVRAMYGSGPIVDAFSALTAPSGDPDITGTASSIYIIKTNNGTQAVAGVGQEVFTVSSANATAGAVYNNNGQTFTVVTTISAGTTLTMIGTGSPTSSGTLTKVSGTGDTTITFSAVSGQTYGKFTALNYGTGGNLFNYTITSLDAEVPPQVTGITVPAFGAPLNGDTFMIRLNGGAASTVTLGSGSGPANPTESANAQTAAHSAYTSLNAMTATPISATLDGQTLVPGTYSTGAATLAQSGAGTLTFNGAGVYVIQVASTLTTGAGGTPTMTLSGGATAANIYWVVGSSATINSGFTGTFQGNIIAEASVTDTLGGIVNGSMIALTGAVTLSATTTVNAENAPLLNYAGTFGLLGASAVTGSTGGGSTVNGNVGSSPTNTINNFPPSTINAGTHNNLAELIIELNSLLPSGITASAGAGTNTLMLTMAGSAAPYAAGNGESFELIDSTPGDLAALGLAPGLTVSSQEPGVEVQIINATTGTNEVFDVTPNVAMTVGYAGSSGTLTINATTLTTNVSPSSSNLSITLSQYTTISELAAFINAQPGYSATSSPSANQLPTSALDQVTAIGIAGTESDTQPGRIKDSAYMFQQAMNTSTVLGFTPIAVAGLPSPQPLVYLSGGLLGPTLAIDIVNAISQMGGIQVNIIVPLFSQDASKDIVAGVTDPGSTYTIAAIDELLKSHCLEYSTPTLKRNRMAILSCMDTYVNCKAQAQSLATYRCSLTCQPVVQVNSVGVNQTFQPWYGAVIAAGMQAGGFYKSICNHLANVVSFVDPVGYDSGDPADVADALIAGLLVLSQNNSGTPWVSDQTTYGLDTNFVYNSIQAVYLSDILSLDLGQTFQTAIVGKSIADVSAASALSLLQQRFDFYKKNKMVTTSNGAPLGYRNASITISAPSMFVNAEALLTTSIYFVAIDLALSAVQQSAS